MTLRGWKLSEQREGWSVARAHVGFKSAGWVRPGTALGPVRLHFPFCDEDLLQQHMSVECLHLLR